MPFYDRRLSDGTFPPPGIKEAAAFGVPSENYGESVGLAIKGTWNEEELKAALPHMMWPAVVLSVDEMPINPSGKRDIPRLKQMAAEQMKKTV